MSKSVSDFTTEPEIRVNRDGLSLTFKPGKMLFSEVPAYNRSLQDAIDVFVCVRNKIEKDGLVGTLCLDMKDFRKVCRHSGERETSSFFGLLEKLFIYHGFQIEMGYYTVDGKPNMDEVIINVTKPE